MSYVNSDETLNACAAGFSWGAIIASFGIGLCTMCNGCTAESSIIKHHAAHYEMDPATGHSTFHWNDEKPGATP